MPKNKKPAAGGRPAKNFDPSYAKGGSKGGPARSGSSKPGSRSAGHRGYRPEEADASRKARWSSEERVASGRSPHRAVRESRDDRAPRESRSEGERGARRFDRDDRAPRSYDRGDRPARSYDRDDRALRRDRDDRPARSYDRDDRAPRRDRDDRPARPHYRDDRPARSFDRDDRAPRRDRDERPARSLARSFDRDDRAPRRDRDERPARSFDRSDRSDRPARSHDRQDRPARSFDRGDRAPRRDFERPGFQESGRRPSSFYPSKDAASRFAPADDVVLERLEAEAIQADAVDGVTFADLGLGSNVVRVLQDLGAVSPFPIQAATIPVVLEGRDVLGRGKTGSGKTIAFGAPTVERLMKLWAESGKSGGKRQMGRKPRALILAPTRELALQIDRTVQPIAQSVGLFTTQIYGGVPQHRQVGALQRGVDIVIGTPGRIEDLIEQRRLDLSEVVVTVIDEADHMCDLGFLEPVQRIIRHTAEGGQRLLFSATLDQGVATLVDEFLDDPAVHEVAGEDQASSTIEHRVFVIGNHEKRDIVAQLANRDGKTLVFSRTRAFAEDLTEHLEDYGIRAVALHGDLNQSRRTRNLQQLTSGRVNVLVATDVAARGIHVDDIDLVIQADAPDEYKTYLHRAGRTGRAGKAGRVVTLIPRSRQRRTADLLNRAEIDVDFEDVRLGDELLVDLGPIELAPVEDLAAEAAAIVEEAETIEVVEVETIKAVEVVEVETIEAVEVVEVVEIDVAVESEERAS
ncbi:DEAD/DEAH box helicase [Agromyces sp. Soil535]|uniref:DEAD/DEAH box helicase n=1 Tax=Agromyces sp. Soil535 TaxID=1736390 RepID=UPI0009E9449B|nr:DEAD/DEAH box helicase [Agromyces sp. Soil535]